MFKSFLITKFLIKLCVFFLICVSKFTYMKHYFTLLLLVLSQTIYGQLDEILDNCGADMLPENILGFSEEFENYYQKQLNIQSKNTVDYYIPVVFHIIHVGEPLGTGSNIADSDIYNALEIVNNHFKNNHNHQNSSNSNIQFVLATKAPDGSCSTGINRINYGNNVDYKNFGTRYAASNNGVAANTIRSLSNWNPTQYYNIWVVNKITSSSNVAAYAYLASSHGQSFDGTFISAQYVNTETSEILVHELGHSLNLYHTFQGSDGTNCPPQINGCGADGDCVSDTPPHIKNHVKDLVLTAANPCSGNNNSSFKNNYMTYTHNVNRLVFTPMQITRMHSAINFFRSSFLPTNNSVFQMNQVPAASFLINNRKPNAIQYVCTGSTISLINTSTCFLNTFNKTTVNNFSSRWEIIRNGQTIITSTEPNPKITLTQPGSYSISLTATNNVGSHTITRNNVLEVIMPSTLNYCVPTSLNVGYFGFAINKVQLHYINNKTGVGINNGYTDFSCTHITQASSTAPNEIVIAASNYNSSIFNNLILEGYIDYNQNGYFEPNEQILSQVVPPSTNNREYTFNFSAPPNVKTNEVLRMRIISERTNISANKLHCNHQFNLADVEDYGVVFVPNLNTVSVEKVNYRVFPNPTNDFLNIEFATTTEKHIEIYSMTGKLLESFTTNKENFKIDVLKFSSGTYILKIDGESYKFIKE